MRTGTRKKCWRIARSPSALRVWRTSAPAWKNLARSGSASRCRNASGASADERADVRGEAVVVWPVVVDVRLRLRPRAIEQRQEAVMEEVEEPAERRDRRADAAARARTR